MFLFSLFIEYSHNDLLLVLIGGHILWITVDMDAFGFYLLLKLGCGVSLTNNSLITHMLCHRAAMVIYLFRYLDSDLHITNSVDRRTFRVWFFVELVQLVVSLWAGVVMSVTGVTLLSMKYFFFRRSVIWNRWLSWHCLKSAKGLEVYIRTEVGKPSLWWAVKQCTERRNLSTRKIATEGQ
jgi:hypothetical protein